MARPARNRNPRWLKARALRVWRGMPRLTRWGWYFLIAGLGLFIAGSQTDTYGLVLLGCMPLSMLAVNALVVVFNLRGIEIKRRHAIEVHAGEPFLMDLLVFNRSGWLTRLGLLVEDTPRMDLFRDDPRQVVMAAPPGMVVRVPVGCSFGQRGPKRLDEIRVETSFPFGLVRRARVLRFASELVVFPRPARLSRELEERLFSAARYFGDSAQTARGDDEVFGVRDYRPGENVRRIHWRTTARAGKPMVLEMEGRRDASFVIVLDTCQTGDPASLRARLEAAVSLCAGATYYLNREGMEFRFAHFGEKLLLSGHGRGDHHYRAIMEKLAQAQLTEMPLSGWIEEAQPGGSHEVCLLLSLGTREQAEARLRHAGGAIVIGALDADFRRHLSFDVVGRGALTPQEIRAGARS